MDKLANPASEIQSMVGLLDKSNKTDNVDRSKTLKSTFEHHLEVFKPQPCIVCGKV